MIIILLTIKFLIMSKKNAINELLSIPYHGHRHRVRSGPDVPISIELSPCCHYSETISVPSYDSKAGRFVRVKQRKLHNPISDLSKYKVSDFFLENQIESGSINGLSRVTMINNDLSASEAHVLNSLSKLESFDNSNDNNVSSVN